MHPFLLCLLIHLESKEHFQDVRRQFLTLSSDHRGEPNPRQPWYARVSRSAAVRHPTSTGSAGFLEVFETNPLVLREQGRVSGGFDLLAIGASAGGDPTEPKSAGTGNHHKANRKLDSLDCSLRASKSNDTVI